MTNTAAPGVKARKVPRILVAGGGYVGLYTALHLRRKLGRKEAAIALVDPRSYMTYQPFLPEAAAGSLEPRHVVAPLRGTLKGVSVINGRIVGIDHAARKARILPPEGPEYVVRYDELVLSMGAVARTLPIPGLAEQGIGFKQVEEAIALRNQILGRLDAADATWDAAARKRMLTFTFVGGGFAGIEALAETEDMAREACKLYDSITPADLRFVVVEAAPRILNEIPEDLASYATDQLVERGIEVRTSTRLESCVGGHVVLSDGTEFDTETLVWTAGMKANPALGLTDLPLDTRGRVATNPALQVVDGAGTVVPGAWAAGDNAAVPDLTSEIPGQTCAPTAQHAVRQGTLLGKNLANQLLGKPLKDYVHHSVGTVASLGLYQGVADVFGHKIRGPLAWFMHRSYHLMAMPTIGRKARILTDWTTALFFKRENVALGTLETPREEFIRAAASDPTAVPTPAPEVVEFAERDNRDDTIAAR